MKRHYCDQCGNEMSYRDKAIANTNEAKNCVTLLGQGKQRLEITLAIQVKAAILIPREDTRPGWERNRFDATILEPVRQHADLCAACRWGLLEQLRAGHLANEDTPFGASENELNWGEPTD